MPTIAVPVLPCVDPESLRDFYSALGFECIDYQVRPYLYLAFRRDGADVHFGRFARDADDTGTCLLLVDDVAAEHAAFKAAIKGLLGRVPASGEPRLTRFRPGATRFTLVDPSGNQLLVIQKDEPEFDYGGGKELSGLAKALDNARILSGFKNDDAAAYRALTSALRRPKEGDTDADRALALAFLLEIAPAAGRAADVAALAGEWRALPVTAEQREVAVATAADPAALRAMLAGAAEDRAGDGENRTAGGDT
ncbi:glyoxalase [Tsukamurella paurometabola]|uniref:Glyoxalase-like domain n=1 Tax=Tsukamurella paurometabola TaxID=2061 RepID=A0A3P8MBY6_TSUPA|nr:glyoxalase [Tsukamurella paurometabola]UEA84655.1 glyoxalase [Tsukamurella paurometabola]VDR37233.1 Glyoxalase-like domain [Tsukamurella paurometabola]